jgi:hypothetical protein
MADPLSVAAGIAGLLSLGIQVTQTLCTFYSAYKNLNSNLSGTVEKLEALLVVLSTLDQTLGKRQFHSGEADLIKTIESSINQCNGIIQELKEECQKLEKNSSEGAIAMVSTLGRRATYPFRKSTLEKLDEDAGEIQSNLLLALEVLQIKDNQRIQDEIFNTRLLLDLVRADQISSKIYNWLKAPDATVDYNTACLHKYSGTGTWLVKGNIFQAWLNDKNSFLWLNGFAGCGKSVLCSTAIQYSFWHRQSNPRVGIAFFFFTFTDNTKQDASGMVRALLLQLAGQLSNGDTELNPLYELYKTGTPPLAVLIQYLYAMIQKFHHVHILLDALDESPRSNGRDPVLDTVEKMRNWHFAGLHLLITSRDVPDIRDALNPLPDQDIRMKNSGVDKDIADFIAGRLEQDRKLRKWQPYRGRIQEVLTKCSKGV